MTSGSFSGSPRGFPKLDKPRSVTGNQLVFRDATVEDAAFIHELRTNEEKALYISKTPADIAKQVAWLANYASDSSQIYFIIEDRDRAPVGTVRLYDQRGDSFCWGSWILKPNAPSSYAIESALMIYHTAQFLGFRKSHFDVRKGNTSVWKFHERFGAVCIRESEEDFFYEIDDAAISASLKRYAKFLPNGVNVDLG